MCYILEKQTRFNITRQIALHRIGGNELTVDSRPAYQGATIFLFFAASAVE
jgi:hypothetical protein